MQSQRKNPLRPHRHESFQNPLRRRNQQSRTTNVGSTSQASESEFASKYKIDRLVYYETLNDVCDVIHREKQIKGLLRIREIALIVSKNPAWRDLTEKRGIPTLPSQQRSKTAWVLRCAQDDRLCEAGLAWRCVNSAKARSLAAAAPESIDWVARGKASYK